MRTSNKDRAALVLWASVGVQLFSGILYIWSIVKDQLIAQYHWSDAEATLPYTLATIVFAVSMFFAGLIQDKKGPRIMASVGTVMLGLGLILSGFANTVGLMILTFSVVVGAGVGINNVATTPAAVKWYPLNKKGMITGLVVAGIAMASVMYSPLIRYLTGTFGLTKGLVYLGIGVLAVSFTLAQFVRNPPPGYVPDGSASPKKAAPGGAQAVEMNWKQMLGTADFYKLFVMFAFSASAGLMIIGHLTKIAKLQAGWDGGFLLLILIAIFNALGRYAGGAVSDKIGRVNLMRIAFLLQAANMAVFGLLDQAATLALGVAVAGLCYGATFSVFPATTADYYGIKNLGANYGMVFMAWGVGGVLGPQIAGGIFDATGSYRPAYWLAFALLLLAAGVSFSLKKGGTAKNK